MNLVELASFELTTRCNLGKIHKLCPNLSPERTEGIDATKVLTDDMIVNAASRLYTEFGFAGLVGWHYYCESLLESERMFRLMARIKSAAPQSAFLLWTNGLLIPPDCQRFAAFTQIHVTNYEKEGFPPRNLDALRTACPDVRVHPGELDARLTAIGNSWSPCVRPHTEIVFDAYSYVHPCCYGWRGKDTLGNLTDDPLPAIVKRFQTMRSLVSGNKMLAGAPQACVKCGMRTDTFTSFVPEVSLAARLHVANVRSQPPMDRTLGVIFVHYAIPEQRLRDHFSWNDALYRAAGAKVYVTTDREYEVPEYAQCIVYREPMKMFSLSKTKNAAIRAALADGCNPILSTDTDIAMPGFTWHQVCNTMPGVGVIPRYKMVRTYEERDADSPIDEGATGVVSLTADAWQTCMYDSRFEGYGAEDGALRLAIARAGIREVRSGFCWHVAHDSAASQVNTPGHGRDDAWNRGSINPDNFVKNRRLIK